MKKITTKENYIKNAIANYGTWNLFVRNAEDSKFDREFADNLNRWWFSEMLTWWPAEVDETGYAVEKIGIDVIGKFMFYVDAHPEEFTTEDDYIKYYNNNKEDFHFDIAWQKRLEEKGLV